MRSPVGVFHFIGSKITERAMRPSGVIVPFNVFKNGQPKFFKRVVSSAISFLLFKFKVFKENLTDSGRIS